MSEWRNLAVAVERVYRRLLLTVGRGRVGVVKDGGSVQLVQVKLGDDEIVDDIKRLSEYGFASCPHPGADAVIVFVGGNRSSGCVIATGDQRYRLHLTVGECAIHDDQGQRVHLTRNGIEVFTPKSYKWSVNGYGQKVTHTGGTSWQVDNYTDGATVTTTNHAVET